MFDLFAWLQLHGYNRQFQVEDDFDNQKIVEVIMYTSVPTLWASWLVATQ